MKPRRRQGKQWKNPAHREFLARAIRRDKARADRDDRRQRERRQA